MDKMPTLKLTPIDPKDKKSDTGNGYYGASLQSGAESFEASDTPGNRWHRNLRNHVSRGVHSLAGRVMPRVRGTVKRRKERPRRKKGEQERMPFITTLQGQIAICSGIILLALALKAVDTPQTQSVSATVEQAITSEADLDQNLGRLQFVQNMFSDSIAVFWQQKAPESLQPPFSGRVSARYSLSLPGIEITGRDDKVFACYEGKVIAVDMDDTGAASVTIKHSGGLLTVYGRLASATVKVNEKVKAGEQIGVAQQNGSAYSMFLQVKKDDVVVDPLPYFQ